MPGRVIFSVFGDNLVAGRMLTSIAVVRKGANNQIRKMAADIFADSQVLVPRDSGELANSGFVRTGTDFVEIGYTAGHAFEVHETPPPDGASGGRSVSGLTGASTLSGRHQRHESPTQWKYLEVPARQRMVGVDKEIQKIRVF